MGQARQRKAEIDQLKAKSAQQQAEKDLLKAQGSRSKSINGHVDLNQWFFDLGDGDTMDRFRVDIIKGLLQSSILNPENLQRLMANAQRGKTSSQTGFGVSMGDLYKSFREIHIGPYAGCDADLMLATFKEFLADDQAKLQPCMSFEGRAISQGWGWVGSRGTVSIKWFKPAGQALTMIGVVANDTLAMKDLSGVMRDVA